MTYRIYFYKSARGEKEIRVFLRRLPQKHRLKCVDYLKRVRQHGTRLPTNIVKHLEAGLWEARPEYGGIEYRFLFFIHDNSKIGIVSAFLKKRQRIERRIIESALSRMHEMAEQWKGLNDEPVRDIENNNAAD